MKRCLNSFIIFILLGYLGVYQGHLALWYDGSEKPARIFAQTVEMYPREDQARLRQGIPFSDGVQLDRLIEDFLS